MMLNFFRKLRRNNMNGKYFKYAIGEILLVVVGILIALQVNTWNEERKNEIKAKAISIELKNDFVNNRKVLAERMELLSASINHANKLLELIGTDFSSFTTEDLDSILVYSLYYGNFNPANATIEEILQTGSSNLINKGSLKGQLNTWLEILKDSDEDFKNQDEHANKELQPYITKNLSARNIDLKGIYALTNRRSLLIDNYYEKAMNDVEFENLILVQMIWNHIMLGHYQELDSLAQEIISSVNQE